MDNNIKEDKFEYVNERFADIRMLRYRVDGFDDLSLRQKTFIYHLSEAALWGRDILFDQNDIYNLRVRKLCEAVYKGYDGEKVGDGWDARQWQAFATYMKCVWFANGIHHHYSCDKFVPEFSEGWLREQVSKYATEEVKSELDELCGVIFNPGVHPKNVNQAEGEDLILTSSCNYYQGVTQEEAEAFYARQKAEGDQKCPVMYGLNSTLMKDANGNITEDVWRIGGKYGKEIAKITEHLRAAREFAEDEGQKAVIDSLVEYYETGDLKKFDEYSILWTNNTEPLIDFVNGFIETYGDPLGLKASWEALVNYKDVEATRRTEILCSNAQWFENNSPVDTRFKKKECKGVHAKAIVAAMLGGDMYPASAIGINLPNSNWIREVHGSKSVTIMNITHACDVAAAGNGSLEEFVITKEEQDRIRKYGDVMDCLHTDLHECLGHGSGCLLEGVDADALKAYGATIEEARADLFALYYMADPKLVELGILPDMEAYKAGYYQQMMNGLMTQLRRIKPGCNIEEAHMRDRALIAYWCYERGKDAKVMELVKRDGKTYLSINDYEALRTIVGELLAEVQRIKSTGDYAAAQALVENYGVKVNEELYAEVVSRYARLNVPSFHGFINPVYTAERDSEGNITDVKLDYTEAYDEQMLRYSHSYSLL